MMEPPPDFPPLLKGQAVDGADPFAAAVTAARAEVEPGLVHYASDPETLRAALTLAPEEPLGHAMAAVVAVELGLADALGALAPPEVAVQIGWPGRVLVNGARCGRVRAAAATTDPGAEPDWLVIGLDLALAARDDAPGLRPEETTLAEEGCGGITPAALLETWSRHSLVWLHSYLDEGFAPLHASWRGRCAGLGEDVTLPAPGRFTGLDERGGMLLREGKAERLIPLTFMLETP